MAEQGLDVISGDDVVVEADEMELGYQHYHFYMLFVMRTRFFHPI